jgi:hypothetical protein
MPARRQVRSADGSCPEGIVTACPGCRSSTMTPCSRRYHRGRPSRACETD